MSYTCTFCNKSLTTEKGLIAHTEAKHGRNGTHSAMRSWEQSRNQLGAVTLATNNYETTYQVDGSQYCGHREQWVCGICNRGFGKKRGLEQHLNSGLHEEKRYQCSGCNREFTSLSGLQQHVNSTGCSSRTQRLVRVAVQDAQDQVLMLTNQGAGARCEATLSFDGATHGSNPSQSGGAGWVIVDTYNNSEIIASNADLTGDDFSWAYDGQVTSNRAEYMGLFRGLQAAKQQGICRLKVEGDSEVVIFHMTGRYQVRDDNLRPLYDMCVGVARGFQHIEYHHKYREYNKKADGLAKQAAASSGYEYGEQYQEHTGLNYQQDYMY